MATEEIEFVDATLLEDDIVLSSFVGDEEVFANIQNFDGEGGSGDHPIFFYTYGSTPYQNVKKAIESNYVVAVLNGARAKAVKASSAMIDAETNDVLLMVFEGNKMNIITVPPAGAASIDFIDVDNNETRWPQVQEKPSIEGNVLEGDLTLEEIGVGVVTNQMIDELIFGR